MVPAQNRTLCSNACKVAACRARNLDRVKAWRKRERDLRRIADEARVRVVVLMGKAKPEPKDTRKRCRDCGEVIDKAQQRCATCRGKAAKKARANYKRSVSYAVAKRMAKARRRAVERGVEAERFDPHEILARDGWRCHICGVSTPKRLRGSYDDRAPELDHIVPLAAGGKHTRQNTACACRKCNIMKSDKPLGQLRLVA